MLHCNYHYNFGGSYSVEAQSNNITVVRSTVYTNAMCEAMERYNGSFRSIS